MIAELLSDKNHKKTSAALCSELGIDERELRRIVAVERCNGAPICASGERGNSGYYITDDPADIEQSRKTLDAKAKDIRRVWKAMGETAQKLKKQIQNVEKDA
jgi:DNA-binding transcriptional regulator PaaX